MIFHVRHVTEVRYSSTVRLARFNLRLRPAEWHDQEVLDYQLTVNPLPAARHDETGPYLVNNTRLTLAEPTTKLCIESAFHVRKPDNAATGDLMGHAPSCQQVRTDAQQSCDLSEYGPASYIFPSPMIPLSAEIGQWAREFMSEHDSVVQSARAVMQAIFTEFTFDGTATQTRTPAIEAFAKRRGVCQDFAQIMISALRANGIPAAYVSGYLRTLPPAGSAPLIGADATHAWVNVWCGAKLEWIGFDPTNNAIAGSDHIFTAMGRDYGDVAPVDGIFLGATSQTLRVSVDVTPVETPN